MSKAEIKEPIQEAEKTQELSPDEIKMWLSKMKKEYCIDFFAEIGEQIYFPEGTMMGNMDVSGKSLQDIFDMTIAKLDSYEPPFVQEAEIKEEPDEVPTWLKGKEALIWHGANENPTWEIKSHQYGKEIALSYVRRGKEMKSGRDEVEQGRKIEAVDSDFSLDEWRVVETIFKEYQALEKDLNSTDENLKKETKTRIKSVLKEENAYRKGGGVEPQILKNLIAEALDKTANKTRGFKKDKIELEALTQKTAEILSQLFVLNRSRGDGADKIPKVKSDIKETPSFAHGLKQLAECLTIQLNAKDENINNDDFEESDNWVESFENAKGITLMIGEAGTGKNEAVEYFAAKTKRPFFWFPCGRGMEAIDLVTHYEFDTKEGTKRFLTELANGIATPGAIVMIDEVNALKPEVQAILHGLGDSNRSLNYDGVRIPVAEGTLIVIAGNPATYGSAGNLGQALLSRTRGQSMVMEYSALTKGDLAKRENGWSDAILEQKKQEDNKLQGYACDEILALFPVFNEFSGLDDKEFELLWECEINEKTEGTKIQELENHPKLKELRDGDVGKHIHKTLVDLRDILRISDAWRKAYEKRSGGFDLLSVGIRDTIAIAKVYKNERDVRKAYLKTFADFRKNPIDGLDSTFSSLELLINNVLSQ